MEHPAALSRFKDAFTANFAIKFKCINEVVEIKKKTLGRLFQTAKGFSLIVYGTWGCGGERRQRRSPTD